MNDWSDATIIYVIPDTVRYVKQFDAGVLDGRVDLLIEQFDTTGLNLNFSEIYFIKDAGSSKREMYSISNLNYRAEKPTFTYSNHDVHFYWGERRFDPNFDQWERPRAPYSRYATAILHSSLTNSEPIVVYESGLWIFGHADIILPVRSVIDQEKIYSVVVLDSTLSANNDPGVPMVGFMKYNLTLDEFQVSKLVFGHTPSIAAHQGEIWIAYLGTDAINFGRNNTYVLHSSDDGATFSEPLLINQSDDFQIEIDIYKTIDNTLHIIHTTSTDALPVPNQLWHTSSKDMGRSWQNKTLIYDTKYENLDETLLVLGSSYVTDLYGQIHVVLQIGSLDSPSRFGLYTFRNPVTLSWSTPQRIGLDFDYIQFLDLEFSEYDNKLYLFWSDTNTRTINYVTKEVSYPKKPRIYREGEIIQLHNIFPNPAIKEVTIPFTLIKETSVQLSLYTLTGSLISRSEMSNKSAGYHQIRFDISNLSSGVYVVDVRTNDSEFLSGKFVVLK